MTDITQSGYKAVAQSIAWASGQALDSATDNKWTDLSDEVDNSATLYVYADLEVVLASAAFSGADAAIEAYLVPTVDGTNYPTWTGNSTSDAQANNQYFIGLLVTTGTTAAQRMVLRAIELPPGKFKFAFRNRGNVTLATGNTAKWRPWEFAG